MQSQPEDFQNEEMENVEEEYYNVEEQLILTIDSEEISTFKQYKRQSVVIDAHKDDLYLMNIDLSSTTRRKTINGVQTEIPIIYIYALNFQGNSFQVNVSGFFPYFFAQIPDGMSPASNFQLLRQEMNKDYVSIQMLNQSQKQQQRKKFIQKCPITRIIPQKKCSIYGYVSEEQKNDKFLMKIECCNPMVISRLRHMFEHERRIAGVKLNPNIYESNISYILRFMVDKDIVGMGWFKLKKGMFKVITPSRISLCQGEIEVDALNLQSVECNGKYAFIAPLRLLSFDIECACKEGFPNPEVNQVIQIACVGKVSNQTNQDFKIVFALKGASPISGVQIIQFSDERDLLYAFQDLVKAYDPDILLGYNIISFDLCYILNRAQKFKMNDYGCFGRSKCIKSRIKKSVLRSKQMGKRQTKQINIDGRIQFDLLLHMLRDHKLTSYTLSNVSSHFLKDQKQGVHHSQIYKLFHDSRDTRRRLAVYCLKDAQLPLRLFIKLCCLFNYAEMARVTGVPLTFLLTRGQQIKVISQLLRKTKHHNYVLPTIHVKTQQGQVGYEGAYVLEPDRGYYQTPIATLDFASLYPSIMIAHNLCYSTLLTPQQARLMNPNDYEKCPIQGYTFVKKNLRKGLLPQILSELISARKKAKQQLAAATDETLKSVLEGRQLAIKISANSVYGFTGATIGQLPCLPISSSVTAYGRTMIDQTKKQVQLMYPTAKVIYGDTDSVMVRFQLEGTTKDQIVQALKIGKEAAEKITKELFSDLAPIKLEFEKVYCPYLLISKKRYAGLYYTKPNKHDKIDKKGIQNVRRDNCLLIREMLDRVLEMLLCQNDIKGIVQYIEQNVSDLVQNKLDISKLVITKAISKDEKGYKNKQTHVELAERMKQRDANINFSIGDRISYIMISGQSGSKNYENAQDPITVLNEDLPIDYDYYIHKQLKPPLERLLKIPHIISNFDALFCGKHTKIRYIPPINKKTGMGKYLKQNPSCSNCPTVTNQILCKKCANRDVQIILQREIELNKLNAEFTSLWRECQTCQGSLLMNIICQNDDCPIFYRRIKVRNQLEKKKLLLDKINKWGNQF